MGANGAPIMTQTNNLIYPYPVVNRSIALGSTTFSPSDNPSTTSTASALILLNGDTGSASISGLLTFRGGDSVIQTQTMSKLTIGSATTGPIQLSPKGTTGLTVDSVGNVGVGTTTPLQALTIQTNTVGDLAGFYDGINNLDFQLADGGSVTFKPSAFDTAQTCSGASCVSADTGVFTDNTTEAKSNGGTPFAVLPAAAAGSGSFYMGLDHKFNTIDIDIAVANVGMTTMVVEYWNGSAWASVTPTDNTALLTVSGTITFTAPADWATKAVNGTTKYFVRIRNSVGTITTAPTANFVTPTNGTRFALYAQSGDANAAIYVNDKGNIGIGTNNPTTKLSIGGTSSTISNTSGDIIINSASGNLDFSNGTLMDINSIGIGTLSPLAPLHINRSSNFASEIINQLGTGDLFTASASGSTKFVITNGGNVGIGTANPAAELHVAKISSVGEIIVGDDTNGTTNATNGINILAYSSGDNYIDSKTYSSGHTYFRTGAGTSTGYSNIWMTVDSTAATVGIGTATPISRLQVTNNPVPATTTGKSALIVDQYENQDILTASASGATRLYLTNTGTVVAQKFADLADTAKYIDPSAGSGSTAISILGDIVETNNAFTISSGGNNNITMSAGTGIINLGNGAGAKQVCVSTDGGTTCTGKIDVGTVDPPYTIDGKNYATYVTSMTGQKEETAGTVHTSEFVPGVGYRATIDFSTVPDGSDLWLFSRVTNLKLNSNQLVVLLSPQADTRSWYTFDPASLTLSMYTARPTTVSYRLTAPRFDWQKWGNIRSPNDNQGMTITYGPDTWTPTGANPTPLDLLANLTIQQATGSAYPYQLVDTTNNSVIEETASFARALIANLQVGIVTGVQGVFQTISSQTITSPIASIDQLQTNVISPLASGSGTVNVALNDHQTFGVLNTQTNQQVTTFDNQGNATLSGNLSVNALSVNSHASVSGSLSVNSLSVNADSTISGTLYADHITTNFGDLTAKISSLEHSIAVASTSSATMVYVSPTPTPTAAPTSSSSGSLAADVISTTDGNATINTNLFVLGDSMLSRTSITGSLLVDGVIRFAENVIETINQTLYIQKNKLANVDILDGTVILDTLNHIFFHGDVAISGNTTVAGVLGASTISPLTGNNLTIDLAHPIPDLTASASASPSATFGDLIIKGVNDAVVARINASGSAAFAGDVSANNLVASGSATVNKLNISLANPNTATTSAIPSNTVGTGLLPTNFTDVTVLSSQVEANTLIYLTPLSSTGNQVLYVKQKLPGVGFIVGLDHPSTTPVEFNWWVIN